MILRVPDRPLVLTAWLVSIFAILNSQSSFGAAEAGARDAAAGPELLRFAAQGRWKEMLDLAPPDRVAKEGSAFEAVLVGHACVIGNRNVEALALFRRFHNSGGLTITSWVATTRKLAADNPTSPAANYLAADALLRQDPPAAHLRRDKAGRHPAQEFLDQALKLDPSFAPALLLQGVLLAEDYLSMPEPAAQPKALTEARARALDAAVAAFERADDQWRRSAQREGWPEKRAGFVEALTSLGTLYVQARVRDERPLQDALEITPQYLPARDALASMRVLKNSASSLAQASKDLSLNASEGSPVAAANFFRLARAAEISSLTHPDDPRLLATDILDWDALVKKSAEPAEPIHVLLGRALASDKFNDELTAINQALAAADFAGRISAQIEAKLLKFPRDDVRLLLQDAKADMMRLRNRLLLEWFYPHEIAPRKRMIGTSIKAVVPDWLGSLGLSAQFGGSNSTHTVTSFNSNTGITNTWSRNDASSHWNIGGISLEQPRQLTHLPRLIGYWGLWFGEPVAADIAEEVKP